MRLIAALAVLTACAVPAVASQLTEDVAVSGPGALTAPVLATPSVASLILSISQPDSPVLIDWATQGGGFDPPVPVFLNVKNASLEPWEAIRLSVGSVMSGAFETSASTVLGMPRTTGLGESRVALVAPGVWELGGDHWEAGATGTMSLFATIPGPAIGAATGSFAVEITAIVPEPAGLAGLSVLFLAGRRGQRFRSHCGTP